MQGQVAAGFGGKAQGGGTTAAVVGGAAQCMRPNTYRIPGELRVLKALFQQGAIYKQDKVG